MSNKLILTDQLYDYMLSHSIRQHPTEQTIRQQTATRTDSRMISAPESTQFIALLCRLMQAERIIEVGVYTGVTTLAMALALPDGGYILACDADENCKSITAPIWREANVANKIDLRIADATTTLQEHINNDQANSFDLAFIDANKDGYMTYYEQCLTLLRPGGLVIVDNALWSGKVADSNEQDADVTAIRQLLEHIHQDERVDCSLIPVADGLALALKR